MNLPRQLHRLKISWAIFSGVAILAAVVAGAIIIPSTLMKSFDTQAIKAKEAEAVAYVGAMNRAQHAYWMEKGAFSNSVEKLGLGIKTQTENYTYFIRVSTSGTSALNQVAFNYGIPRKDNLKSYIGLAGFGRRVQDGTRVGILCESDSPGTAPPANPTYQNNVMICSPGTHRALSYSW